MKIDSTRLATLAEIESSVSATGDQHEVQLQALLERYTIGIEQQPSFDREQWLQQACLENPAIEDDLVEAAKQVDALIQLSGRPLGLQSSMPSIAGFTLIRQLGTGGTGVVYEAIEDELQRRVALKLIAGVWDQTTKSHARFMIEAQAAARLNHPHIVPIYRIGEGDQLGASRFLAMQLVEGGSLSHYLKHQRPSCDQAVGWMIDVADAISHAHECGVIHRDIKPGNLMLDLQHQIKVTDFGLARLQSTRNGAVESNALTEPGDCVGTLAYMSPQQAAGEPLDERTDVYSLGLTLFELLVGRRALEGETYHELMRSRQKAFCFSARSIDPRVPKGLDRIVSKATMAELGDRYQSASDFAEDLRRFQRGETVLAASPSVLSRARCWLIRHRRIASFAAMGVLLVTLVSWALAAKLAVANRDVQQALDLSQQDLQRSEEILDRFGILAADDLRNIEGAQAVRLELLRSALTYYEQLTDRIGERIDEHPELVQRKGMAHFKAAQILDEIGADQQASGGYRSAIKYFESVPSPPVSVQRAIGISLNNLAVIEAESGQFEKAGWLYQESVQSQASLMQSDQPFEGSLDLASTYGNAAVLMIDSGQQATAKQHLQAGLAVLEDSEWSDDDATKIRSMLLSQMVYLADGGSSADAIDTSSKIIASLQELLQRTSKQDQALRHIEVCRLLATALSNHASLHSGHPEQVVAYLNASEQQLASIATLMDLNPSFLAQWATIVNNLGRAQVVKGDIEQGLAAFERSKTMLAKLCDAVPSAIHYRTSLAGVLFNLGQANISLGSLNAAAQSLEESLTLQQSTRQIDRNADPILVHSRDELIQQTELELKNVRQQIIKRAE
ncbi:serine/threonine protein kinase [Stieleria sp. JC731]|uniref:serine/threonine protein kinase n=1 Tax=Pirellulaceae TaxID=2691357 RepID=UPI001E61F70A|nr:serine/threonine-protein kinase [Stieleria sp. JC731]MCC9599401.1 serine/threonine protein kinase [Stieleria sp. JC731]